MFVARCRTEQVHPIKEILYLVATTDWNNVLPPLQNRAPNEMLLLGGHLHLHPLPHVHAHEHGRRRSKEYLHHTRERCCIV
jgi:hypothetical protein